MKKILLLTFCAFLLSINSYAASDKNNTNKPLEFKVGYVTEANTQGGCSCAFYWPRDENKKEKNIFSSNLGEEIWMNLNGKDAKLTWIKSVNIQKDRRKGSRFYEIYQCEKIKIRVDYLVTWTCVTDAPDDDSCEETHFDIKITFSQNGRHKIIKAKGACGC
jgi:hypothetical protein